uniref:Cation efflux protein transmembrane domain-containing protein n=1 Tax=Odontella aurita TaxID=265563 RepID=A0A7S4JB62_9STRA|mmetsp:Transcript_42773/g.130007  ORF Transcript_42773/g.130007 Transcript_42773/m.130007 type:complete len:744 (+) Transcript_42773:197-2428(+)
MLAAYRRAAARTGTNAIAIASAAPAGGSTACGSSPRPSLRRGTAFAAVGRSPRHHSPLPSSPSPRRWSGVARSNPPPPPPPPSSSAVGTSARYDAASPRWGCPIVGGGGRLGANSRIERDAPSARWLWPMRCLSTASPRGDDDGDGARGRGRMDGKPFPPPLMLTSHPGGMHSGRGEDDAAARRRRTQRAQRLALRVLAAALSESDAAAAGSRRYFSADTGSKPPISPPGDDARDKGADRQTAKEAQGGDTRLQQRTDADFAEYLKGGTDEAHVGDGTDERGRGTLGTAPLPSSSSSSSSSPQPSSQQQQEPPQDEWRHLHKNHPNLTLPSQRELTEAYRRIERNQRSSLEKSIAATSANVRRALYGNLVICVAKFGAWLSSGSSAMLSEFIHSVVDCGNQSLLLVGLRDSGMEADRKHPYGYGKSVYFWALVSALGTFFLGAGVSMTHAVGELMGGPSLQEVTWHVWSVLGLSFAVDGYVLWKTVAGLRVDAPDGTPFWTYVRNMRDPATLAILLEDGAACLGVVIAIAGIGATSYSGMPVFDGLAGVTISGLLAAMGLALVRVNHRFLLGQAVDPVITRGIEDILTGRSSIENVYSVQSQWTGPDTFSYKAEVDFDGTFLAAKIMPRYQREFLEARDTLDSDLRVLLSWYAEDVMRTVEREVRDIEADIREAYPGAEFIELEPMSKDSNRFAIDDGMEAQLKRIETDALNHFLSRLYKSKGTSRSKKADGDEAKKDGRGKS